MRGDLTEFLGNSGFVRLLERCWMEEEGSYHDDSTSLSASPGLLQYLAIFHVYQALRGDSTLPHRKRAESLGRRLAASVRADGLLDEPSGAVVDHPAHACHVADGLGTFAHYGAELGWDGEVIAQAKAALTRLVDCHSVVRRPEGTVGRTQQMRFELRAWYWAWRVTGEQRYKEACLELWENGIHAYQNPLALHGGLLQPSLHPDWTWNYTCSSGTTTEYATNTHTPVYYNTEPQGFAFVYAHGLKDGVFDENPVWNQFCRDFFQGLLRNLSRAGHTSSDVDGYGVHRAWYAGCLVETAPVEAAGLADRVGCGELRGWFRWYVDRFVDFIRRSPEFEHSGLTSQCPYGHNITVEKQFPPLMAARFYAHLARALHEYELEKIAPIAPPALASYAWWHNWLRVSTPSYETSFVGTTSLRDIPKVRNFGDPNLGCIHGGSPISTLFSGERLLFATSNDPAGLWQVELTDCNGNIHRSCGTSFRDETALAVRTSGGRLLHRDSFRDYDPPLNFPVGDTATEILWAKNLARNGIRFFVHNSYEPESFSCRWGGSFPRGLFVQSAVFILTVPTTLSPYWLLDGAWLPLTESRSELWPEAIRWGNPEDGVLVRLSTAPGESGGCCSVTAVPARERSPGGENSFCPFPVWQVRLAVALTPLTGRVEMGCEFYFGEAARPFGR